MTLRYRVAVVALLAATCVQAQTYPDRPIRLLVGFPPGGPIDLQARLIGQRVSQSIKQPVVIDNKPGADAVIATEILAKSPPDGYTLILVSIGFATVANFHSKLPYDPAKDFVPVIYTASGAMMLVANPALPASSVNELLGLARQRPGAIDYGSAGIGSSNHLGVELFTRAAGVKMHHVPYKGAAPATTDLLSGRIQLMLNPISNALPHVRSGKLRPIAVSTAKRSPAAPDVPTIGESVPGYDVSLWSGILAPAGTPAEVVALLNREVGAALAAPDVRDGLATHGFETVGGSPRDFAMFIDAELKRWSTLVADAGLKKE